MSFTHDTSTDEGVIRTLIDDATSTDYEFEDAEITAVLDQNSGDVWAAAADLCRALAAKYSKKAMRIGLGKQDIELDLRDRAKYYMALASKYDSRSSGDLVEYVDSFNYNIDGDGVDESEYIGDE